MFKECFTEGREEREEEKIKSNTYTFLLRRIPTPAKANITIVEGSGTWATRNPK
jgi:hypothetical protein